MPPIAAVTGGITVVGLCFLLRIPIFLIGLLSAILLIYTLFVHKSMFGLEYKTMTAPEFMKANASIFIVLAIILIALGYILYMFGPKAAIHNAPLSLHSNELHQPSRWPSIFSSKTPYNSSYSTSRDPRRQYISNYDRELLRRKEYESPFIRGV